MRNYVIEVYSNCKVLPLIVICIAYLVGKLFSVTQEGRAGNQQNGRCVEEAIAIQQDGLTVFTNR